MRFLTCILYITTSRLALAQNQDFAFPIDEENKNDCKEGKCVAALECEVLLNTQKYQGFRPKICFFYLKEPYVCCPVKGLNGTIEGTFLGQRLSDQS